MNDKLLTGWLGLADFFNYYLPGLLWVMNIIFLLGVVDYTFLIQSADIMNQIDSVIVIVLGLMIPYVAGILLGFLGTIVNKVDRILFGSPVNYVLHSERKKSFGWIKFGSSLGKKLAQRIENLMYKKFGSDLSSDSLYFNTRYSLQFASYPRPQSHISRLTNLINLHEGFIPPLLFGSVIAFYGASRLNISGLNILGTSLLVVFIGIWQRYRYLREVRVKQVYRYFFLWHIVDKEDNS